MMETPSLLDARREPLTIDDADHLKEIAAHIEGRYPGAANFLRTIASKIWTLHEASQ